MITIKQHNDTIVITGIATYKTLQKLISGLSRLSEEVKTIDIRNLEKIDTSSIIFLQDFSKSKNVEILTSPNQNKLINIVKENTNYKEQQGRIKGGFFYDIGYNVYIKLTELYLFFGFLGEIFVYFFETIMHPKRFRLKAISNDIEKMGLNAVPIIFILSLLIGVVIAYQGSVRLRQFGANIFIVDLVSISITRELGPLIVAILLAGRSASSYTAQIGIMKVTEEIDIIKTMGLHPFDVLVFPKIISTMISLPLLVVLADVAGILGGSIVAHISLGISFYDFFSRLHNVLSIKAFISGLIKAPVFAFFISVIGCFKGFRTQKNVESIGKNVTISVVDSIFAVIVIDAVFSILFRWAGI